jgi:hypothetical protein
MKSINFDWILESMSDRSPLGRLQNQFQALACFIVILDPNSYGGA